MLAGDGLQVEDMTELLTDLGAAVDLSTVELSLPTLHSATYDGKDVYLTFDAPTDRAGHAGGEDFPCSEVVHPSTLAQLYDSTDPAAAAPTCHFPFADVLVAALTATATLRQVRHMVCHVVRHMVRHVVRHMVRHMVRYRSRPL